MPTQPVVQGSVRTVYNALDFSAESPLSITLDLLHILGGSYSTSTTAHPSENPSPFPLATYLKNPS